MTWLLYALYHLTVKILSFQTDRSGRTVQTQIRLLLVYHSICTFSMEKPCLNFRLITAYILGVRKFRTFTVNMFQPVGQGTREALCTNRYQNIGTLCILGMHSLIQGKYFSELLIFVIYGCMYGTSKS